jgi:GNAT superfamily N-acetyltransferase
LRAKTKRMELHVQEVSSRRLMRTFIYLPEQLHKGRNNWVHPYYPDEWTFFDPTKNKQFTGCDTLLLIAFEGEQPVGRAMGIINHNYNRIRGESGARFCFLESREDIRIPALLLDHIETWAREKGCTILSGPLGFSDKDPQGMLIEGFEEPVVIATNYNFPWMPLYLEQLGFSKGVDLVSYKMTIPYLIPFFFQRVYERTLKRNDCRLHTFTTRKSLKPWIAPIFHLVNETYASIFGFSPVTEEEMHGFARRYLPVIDPRFVMLVTDTDGAVIAFLISMPELSKGIRRARGRLWPFGWAHILMESRRTRLLTMLLGAIKENWRGKGIDTLMGMALLKAAHKAGMKTIDSHLILETNLRMRAEYERMGGVVHKKFRVYNKVL